MSTSLDTQLIIESDELTTPYQYDGCLLIFSIHRTDRWWRHLGLHSGYRTCVTVSDIKGDGDFCTVDDFYVAYQARYSRSDDASALLSESQVDDVIARCRVLRWLPRRQAAAMALAMADVMQKIIDTVKPSAVLSFPIDRYAKDVLARRAMASQIPYLELTASPLPGMSMLLNRDVLLQLEDAPEPSLVDAKVAEIANPAFTPSYVQGRTQFTLTRFLRSLLYFKMRGLAFKAIATIKGDPLNLHYLDAQSHLGHKPRLADRRVLSIIDADWRARILSFAKSRRLLMGLQLYPEASIDYWIRNAALIDHEALLYDVAEAFSQAGYVVLVKDHPLQFGFRQVALLEKLKTLPNVVMLPYDVSGNEALDLVDNNFTCTGTLGLQAALAGKKSIVTRCYYSNDEDFIILADRPSVTSLPDAVERMMPPATLEDRQRRIISHLLRGSFDGDFFSFKKFSPATPNPAAADLGAKVGARIARLVRAHASTKDTA